MFAWAGHAASGPADVEAGSGFRRTRRALPGDRSIGISSPCAVLDQRLSYPARRCLVCLSCRPERIAACACGGHCGKSIRHLLANAMIDIWHKAKKKIRRQGVGDKEEQ